MQNPKEFAEMWSQLELGVKSENMNNPKAISPPTSQRVDVDGPIAPSLNGLPLRPPPAWLRQNVIADNGSVEKIDKASLQCQGVENVVLPSSAVKTGPVQLQNPVVSSTVTREEETQVTDA